MFAKNYAVPSPQLCLHEKISFSICVNENIHLR